MPILEDVKDYMQRATGLRRPGKEEAPDLAHPGNLASSASRMTGSFPIIPLAVRYLLECCRSRLSELRAVALEAFATVTDLGRKSARRRCRGNGFRTPRRR